MDTYATHCLVDFHFYTAWIEESELRARGVDTTPLVKQVKRVSMPPQTPSRVTWLPTPNKPRDPARNMPIVVPIVVPSYLATDDPGDRGNDHYADRPTNNDIDDTEKNKKRLWLGCVPSVLRRSTTFVGHAYEATCLGARVFRED